MGSQRSGSLGHGLRSRIKDDKGHYERWPELRVHPDMDTAVKTYLADPSCEYESMADFIRGCVLIALPQLKVSNPSTKSVISILKAVAVENSQMEMRRRFMQHIKDTASEAYELIGEGRVGEAAKHVHRVLLHVRDMDKDDPWREEFEKVIKDRFGHLFRLTQAASLLPDGWELGKEEREAALEEEEWRGRTM